MAAKLKVLWKAAREPGISLLRGSPEDLTGALDSKEDKQMWGRGTALLVRSCRDSILMHVLVY